MPAEHDLFAWLVWAGAVPTISTPIALTVPKDGSPRRVPDGVEYHLT
jgi:hypothetical protein